MPVAVTADIVGEVFDWGLPGWRKEVLFFFYGFVVELANGAQLRKQVAQF